jgi:hypothetical protein
VLRAFRGLQNASASAENLEPILATGAALHNLDDLDNVRSQHWTSWSWCGVVRRTEGGACSSPGESEALDIPEVDRAAVLDGEVTTFDMVWRFRMPRGSAFNNPFSPAVRCKAE